MFISTQVAGLPIAGSKDMNDWSWTMTSYHTEPVTYTRWRSGQPDNSGNKGQDIIILKGDAGYGWQDYHQYIDAGNVEDTFCFICECTP